MFCTNCGEEVGPGNSFCPNCGEPARQAAPATPAPTTPPPVSPAPGPPLSPPSAVQPPGAPIAPTAGKKPRRWLIALISGGAVLAVVALVLVLVLVVFKSPSPESAVDLFFQALARKDADTIIDNTDLSAFRSEPGLDAEFKQFVRDEMPKEGSLEFSGLGYQTSVTGDEAVVKVVAGKASFSSGTGKKEVTEISESEGSNTFYLVKKGGKWLYGEKTFPDFFARVALRKADDSLTRLEGDYAATKSAAEGVFDELGAGGFTSFAQLAAAYKEKQAIANSSIDKFVASAEAAKSDYQKVADLKGNGKYSGYAGIRVQQVDTYIKIAGKLKSYLGDLGNLLGGWVTNPPASGEAVEQQVTSVANSYEAQFQSLETQAQELGKQADALGKNLGL